MGGQVGIGLDLESKPPESLQFGGVQEAQGGAPGGRLRERRGRVPDVDGALPWSRNAHAIMVAVRAPLVRRESPAVRVAALVKLPPPVSYLARRVLRLPRTTLSRIARREWVLVPALQTTRPPAIFLDGQLERVAGVQGETTMDVELARVLGGEVWHVATMAYELQDAAFVDGSVYAGGERLRLLDGVFRMATLRRPEQEIDQAALACTYVGNRYFGHWIADDCTLHLLAREHGRPVGVARAPYGQEEAYRRIWGMETRSIASALVRSLVVFEDYAQNDGKRQRYEWLRARVQQPGPGARGHGAYLRRGTAGSQRLLANEAEIEERLLRRGFVSLDPAALTVDEVVKACSGVSCVVSVEGSHLAHGLMNVAPGGALIVLQPPARFNNVYKDRADCAGLRYGFVVGTPDGAGFRIDADEVERTLDLVGTAR